MDLVISDEKHVHNVLWELDGLRLKFLTPNKVVIAVIEFDDEDELGDFLGELSDEL